MFSGWVKPHVADMLVFTVGPSEATQGTLPRGPECESAVSPAARQEGRSMYLAREPGGGETHDVALPWR